MVLPPLEKGGVGGFQEQLIYKISPGASMSKRGILFLLRGGPGAERPASTPTPAPLPSLRKGLTKQGFEGFVFLGQPPFEDQEIEPLSRLEMGLLKQRPADPARLQGPVHGRNKDQDLAEIGP